MHNTTRAQAAHSLVLPGSVARRVYFYALLLCRCWLVLKSVFFLSHAAQPFERQELTASLRATPQPSDQHAGVQVFQFVGVTITNKLAANSPFAAGLSATQAAERTHENKCLISYSLTFAVIAGIVTAGGLLGFSHQILGVMGTSAEMMAPAVSYLQWRAIAAPAVMIMNVCQGICLGQQNSMLPLAVFSGVGMLNVVLDVWLILGGPAMGCTGAAIATAAAQWLGAGYFLHNLIRKVSPSTTMALCVVHLWNC